MDLFNLTINLVEAILQLIIVNLVYKKFELLKLSFFTLIIFSLTTYCNVYNYDSLWLMPIYMLITSIYACSVTKKFNSTNIFLGIISENALNIANSIALILYSSWLINVYDNFNLTILISKIAYAILIIGFSKLIRVFNNENKKIAFLVNTSILYMNFIFTIEFNNVFFQDATYEQFVIVLLVCLSITLLVLFNEARKESQLLYENKLKVNSLELQKRNYLLSKENIEKTSKIKHDYIHVCNSVLFEIENGNYNKASEILRNQIHRISNVNKVIITNNDIIDYSIELNSIRLKDNNIEVISDRLSNDLPFKDVDLFIIFGNLLDNAIENCEANPTKKIIISMGNIENCFYFTIKNTIKKSVLNNNPNLVTTKDNSQIHGFGLSNCLDIIEQYHGEMIYNENKQFFEIKILIPEDE